MAIHCCSGGIVEIWKGGARFVVWKVGTFDICLFVVGCDESFSHQPVLDFVMLTNLNQQARQQQQQYNNSNNHNSHNG
jgi:hypothetical protein